MVKRTIKRPRKYKSPKGALIEGMSKNLPSDILTDPVFTKKLNEIMRGHAGIYALYKNNKLYYVGLTGNLHGRIKWHLKDKHSGKWDYFKIFRIRKVQYLKDIETLIHHIAETPGNRQKGQVPRDSDLTHALREVLSGYEKKAKVIKKALQ